MFAKTRFKLTLWYLLILMLVSSGFSLVIYKALTLELDRFSRLQRLRLERHLNEKPSAQLNPYLRSIPPKILADPELIEETKKRLILFLIIVNSGILIVSGGLAYFLAGKTLKPIKEMIDEQNQFISDASHELKTPLTSLKSAMEVYLRDKTATADEAKKLVRDNIKEVNKLQALSEGLLKLASFQKPNHQTKFSKISLALIVKEAIKRVKPQALKKKITIRNLSQNLELEADPYALTDLLVILLDNAIKYSQTKKIVVIETKKTDGLLIITVTDQGIGISEKDLPHIFNRFWRADLARSKTKISGFGLGLSIAKKIVETHKGKITAKSKLGQGTTFKIQLPIKQSANKFRSSFFS